MMLYVLYTLCYCSIRSSFFLLLSLSSYCTSIYYLASGAGIYKHDAKSAPSGVKLRESYSMGIYKGTSTAIDKIIDDMRIDFQGNDYHVCNAFADEFLKRLVSNGIPGYVNRMAYIGSYFSCFMPDSLNQDPTQGNNNNYNSNGLYSNSQSSQRLNKNPIYTSSNGNKLGGGTSSSSSTTATNVATMGATDDAAMLRDKIRQATLSRQQKLSNK